MRRVRRKRWDGRHGQIRTADLSLRRRPLYPSELRARALYYDTRRKTKAEFLLPKAMQLATAYSICMRRPAVGT